MILARYRAETAGLVARLRAHCEQIGINPPDRALRRYASLRYIEAYWWLRDKLTDERAELLEDLSYRLRLPQVARGCALCLPDIAHCVRDLIDPRVLAPWPDEPLMVGIHELL